MERKSTRTLDDGFPGPIRSCTQGDLQLAPPPSSTGGARPNAVKFPVLPVYVGATPTYLRRLQPCMQPETQWHQSLPPGPPRACRARRRCCVWQAQRGWHRYAGRGGFADRLRHVWRQPHSRGVRGDASPRAAAGHEPVAWGLGKGLTTILLIRDIMLQNRVRIQTPPRHRIPGKTLADAAPSRLTHSARLLRMSQYPLDTVPQRRR